MASPSVSAEMGDVDMDVIESMINAQIEYEKEGKLKGQDINFSHCASTPETENDTRDKNASGSFEVNIDSLISQIIKILHLPSDLCAVDTLEGQVKKTTQQHRAATDSSSGNSVKLNNEIILDKELCKTISSDVNKLLSCRDKVADITTSLLQSIDSSSPDKFEAKDNAEREPFEGAYAQVAMNCPPHDPINILKILMCISQENRNGADNLQEVLFSQHQFWKLFPHAVYATIDSLLLIVCLWFVIGGSINLSEIAKNDNVHHNKLRGTNDPLLKHTMKRVSDIIQYRNTLVPPTTKNNKDVNGDGPARPSLTELISGIILDVVDLISKKLAL